MTEFPKIIWQTHKWDYDNLPDIYKKTTKTWQVMNPEWEYRYVPNKDMRSFLEKLNNQSLLNFFDKNDNAMQQADIWREAMIYEHGGLWADLDSICIFPIDKVIKNNKDKEMICISPVLKFGMDENNNYKEIGMDAGIDRILSGKEFGYWISNAAFLGKRHNKISEQIFKSMTQGWNFKESSFMGTRAELYEQYHELMSLDLICAYHDGRFNDRNYI
jgi:mannosyltransferase OCH1-like enzyme